MQDIFAALVDLADISLSKAAAFNSLFLFGLGYLLVCLAIVNMRLPAMEPSAQTILGIRIISRLNRITILVVMLGIAIALWRFTPAMRQIDGVDALALAIDTPAFDLLATQLSALMAASLGCRVLRAVVHRRSRISRGAMAPLIGLHCALLAGVMVLLHLTGLLSLPIGAMMRLIPAL